MTIIIILKGSPSRGVERGSRANDFASLFVCVCGGGGMQMFFCPLYWLYTGIFVILLIVYGIWDDLPGVQSWRIPSFLAGTLTSVAIFTISFYNANVFDLYWKKVSVILDTNESVEQVYAMAGSFWSK